MGVSRQTTQSPTAYSSQNLKGNQLAVRMAGTASAGQRADLVTAIQDKGYRYKIHPKETAAGRVDADLTFGFEPGDIRRYGAVDGGGDCATAFVRAWQSMGVVLVPAGTWSVQSQAVFNGSHIEIFGAGMDMSFVQMSAAGQFVFGDSTFAVRNFNMRMSDLTIAGNLRGQATDAVKIYAYSWFHISHVIFYYIKGNCLYGERCFDGSVEYCHFQTSGDTNKACIHLPYISVEENNHWTITGCQFETSYWSDFYSNGASVEAAHFITNNKFGVQQYTATSATDPGMYHIQCAELAGTSIHDNWFFTGGMCRMENCVAYQVCDNYAASMSQGIWDAGGGGQGYLIHGNHIQGNNDGTDPINGSQSANHWGIRVDGQNAQVGPNNDVISFNVHYQVWAGAINNYLIYPMSGGSADTVADAGTLTHVQMIDGLSANLTLLNSWVAAGAGFAAPSYSRHGNQVVLKGMVKNGTLTAGTSIATLPAGSRPDATRYFANYTDNGSVVAFGGLQIDTGGNIKITGVPAGTVNISLDGMAFSLI